MDWSKGIKSVKEDIKSSSNPLIHILYSGYLLFLKFYNMIYFRFLIIVYNICRLFPLKDKVVSRSFEGRKLGDNPEPIMEELYNISEGIDLVWIVKPNNHQKIPKEMRYVSTNHAIRVVYEYATAKVWIDTHHIKECLSKRKGQIIVETWHGGLGIKKLELDVPLFQQPQYAYIREIVRHTVECADIFLSNSDHLTKIYRRAFEYKGVIWKSGYPKNDVIIHNDIAGAKKKCYAYYSLQDDIKVVVYAPTYRDEHREDEAYLNQVYNLDGRNLCNELGEKFGGRWKMLIRLHPVVNVEVLKCMTDYSEFVIDATEYPDMQELILASDIFVSDYSSCIFDAALRNIPCFTFATDFEEYKADRGVYYEMEELPFPYAKNNEELVENIRHFNYEEYIKKWEAFKVRTGLYETGHAAKDIAYVINEYIKGNTKPLEDIQSEP